MTLSVIALSNVMLFSGLGNISIALPSIAKDLGVTSSELHWMVIGALLPMAFLSIISGRIGDAYGRRRLFLAGVAVFGFASVGCALAPVIEALIAFRVLQGIGIAVAVPLAVSNLAGVFPVEERGRALGRGARLTTVGTIGMTLFLGAVVEYAGWRWVFCAYAVMSLVVIAATLRFVPETRDENPPPFDPLGCLLLTVGLLLIVVGLEQWSDWGIADARICLLLGSGAAVMFVFVWHELRAPVPLIELRTLRGGQVPFALVFLTVVQCLSIFLTFNLPIFLEHVESYGSLLVSIVLAMTSIGSLLLAPYAGRSADAGRARLMLTGGLGLGVLAAGLAVCGVLSRQYAAIAGAMVLLGCGTALVYTPATSLVISAHPETEKGISSALTVEARQLGATVGLASCQVLMTSMEWLHRRPLLEKDLAVGHGALDKVLFDSMAAPALGHRSAAEVDAAVDSAFVFGFITVLLVLTAIVLATTLTALWAFERPGVRHRIEPSLSTAEAES
ncbi:MFS transporter [Streptomyces sp. NBC_00069]|uniref:MFS transporter n=1 Tax=Streptomyces sp. NBC_00069 TaxID=2975639 RepID=UPI0032494C62